MLPELISKMNLKGTKGSRRIWLKLAYIATVTGAISIYDDKMYFTWN